MIHSLTGAKRNGQARTGVSLLAIAATIVSLLALVSPVAANGNGNGQGPRGNNGTIKIDGNAFDTHPNNEPHVDCIFQVDFYGYDAGDLWANVTFEVHPPTGNAVILTDSVWIGEDDNSGGGSEGGLDAEAGDQDLDGTRFYDLSSVLVGYEPHDQQGFHIKLTINADGSQGADRKHKVFWVAPCELPQTPTEPPTGGTEPPDGTNPPGGTNPPDGTNPPTGGVNPSTDRPGTPGSNVVPNTAFSLERSGGTIIPLVIVLASLLWLGAAQLMRSGSESR